MTLLRIALPPLASLTAQTEFEFVQWGPDGPVGRPRLGTLMQLGSDARSQAVECFLHPVDSVLTRIELPPLSAARTVAAVSCAAQALILGDVDRMHIAHSPRDDSGLVYLSWLPKVQLEHLGQLLGQHRMLLRGLYPAPYRLALPPAGQTSACLQDGQLLLRLNAEQGAVEPFFQDRLAELSTRGGDLYWLGEDTPDGLPEPRPTASCWSGVAPKWGLHGGVLKPDIAAVGWGRAVGCCVLALAVWTIGLNLYAAREASQGQRIKQQMSQRVKQAFPELPVILNPLQQARQQLAARKQGATDDPARLFNRLVLQAGSGMPFMAGSVERLVFAEGALQITPMADARPPGGDPSWQQALAQAGISARTQEGVWTLRIADEPVAASSGPDDQGGVEDE